MSRFNTIDDKTTKNEQESNLEKIVPNRDIHQKKDPADVVHPVSQQHILRLENRPEHTPGQPKNNVEFPVKIDMRKVEEDYNSVDYQILAMNLWQNQAKEII